MPTFCKLNTWELLNLPGSEASLPLLESPNPCMVCSISASCPSKMENGHVRMFLMIESYQIHDVWHTLSCQYFEVTLYFQNFFSRSKAIYFNFCGNGRAPWESQAQSNHSHAPRGPITKSWFPLSSSCICPRTSSTSHTCWAFIASSASRSASSYGENGLLEKDIPFGKASMIITFLSATFNFDNVSC